MPTKDKKKGKKGWAKLKKAVEKENAGKSAMGKKKRKVRIAPY